MPEGTLRRMFTTFIAAAALTTAGAALAVPAHAADVDLDTMLINTDGFDLGASDGDWQTGYGKPDNYAKLVWSHANGQISAHLDGALWLDDVDGQCARMRLDYRDADGDALHTEYGGTVCAEDDDRAYWLVDRGDYASPETAELEVSIETKASPYSAFSVAASSVHHPNISADSVKITTDGFDFGNDNWLGSAPTGWGDVWWRLGPSGVVTPHVMGTLWLNNVEDDCARMNIRYLSAAGSFLTERAGGTVCAFDDDRHGWTVDLEPYGSNKIGGITVQLQTENANGTWSVAGSQTVMTECYCAP